MTTNDRHDTDIDLLDRIIGVAGGVTKETRQLSFRMEKAVRGRANAEPEAGGGSSGKVEELQEYVNSTELRKGLNRRTLKQVRQPNPFDYKMKTSNAMNKKLDAILNKLQTVSTKDDLKTVNRRIDKMEDRLTKLEGERELDTARRNCDTTVSYTHLTLPTIYSV